MTKIPIIIADDDPGMRQLLQAIVSRAEGYELRGVAENGQALLELFEALFVIRLNLANLLKKLGDFIKALFACFLSKLNIHFVRFEIFALDSID